MRDPRPATEAEIEQYANDWRLYANEHLEDKRKARGPNVELLDEVRWGSSGNLTFNLTALALAGQQTIQQIIDITVPARVWSLHFAMTLVGKQVLPVGDAVNAFIKVTVGIGSSTIDFGRTLLGTAMVANPFDPTSMLTTDLIVSDVPARKILVSAFVLYTAAIGNAPETQVVRIDAAAAPVIR